MTLPSPRRRIRATGPTGALFILDMSDWDVLIPDEQLQAEVARRVQSALQFAGCEAWIEEATAPKWVAVGGPS